MPAVELDNDFMFVKEASNGHGDCWTKGPKVHLALFFRPKLRQKMLTLDQNR